MIGLSTAPLNMTKIRPKYRLCSRPHQNLEREWEWAERAAIKSIINFLLDKL